MGYIKHEAIIVTGWNEERLTAARDKAVELELVVTPFAESPVNGYKSFLIVPDGSKEGWEESDKGEVRREAWISWASDPEAGGSRRVDWAMVRYGGDDPELADLTAHNPH